MLPEYADGALIFSNTNRRYFTEFVSSLGYLLVTKISFGPLAEGTKPFVRAAIIVVPS